MMRREHETTEQLLALRFWPAASEVMRQRAGDGHCRHGAGGAGASSNADSWMPGPQETPVQRKHSNPTPALWVCRSCDLPLAQFTLYFWGAGPPGDQLLVSHNMTMSLSLSGGLRTSSLQSARKKRARAGAPPSSTPQSMPAQQRSSAPLCNRCRLCSEVQLHRAIKAGSAAKFSSTVQSMPALQRSSGPLCNRCRLCHEAQVNRPIDSQLLHLASALCPAARPPRPLPGCPSPKVNSPSKKDFVANISTA